MSIAVALLAAMGTSHAAVADEVSSYATIKPSLALVVVGAGKNLGFGTAFCVESAGGYGFLLTNKHVVGTDPHPRIVLMSNRAQAHTSAIVRVAGLVDAVVLAINSTCVPVTMSNTTPPVGTRIAIAGFPTFQLGMFLRGLGLSPSFHEGSISSIVGDGTLLQYDAQTDLGNSGSPLFDIESGQVYGLVRAVNTGATGALQNNTAIGSAALRPFLQNASHDIATGLRLQGVSDTSTASGSGFTPPQEATLSPEAMPQLPEFSFGFALNRLIADASSQFVADRYGEVRPSNVGPSFFSMAFTVTGYTNCTIVAWDDPKASPTSAGCTAYQGTNMSEAKRIYSLDKAALAAFAHDAGGSITEKVVTTLPETRELTATYDAGEGVIVTLSLDLDVEPIVELSVEAPSR